MMPIEISVQCADVANVAGDLLLLKYAQSFHGADQAMAARLAAHGICTESDLSPQIGQHVLIDNGGAIAAARTLFLGTPPLGKFGYREMKQFARRAIELIGEKRVPVRTLTTTIHGAGYGLDAAEALRSMLFGFQQGLATTPLPQLERIIFVERNSRRCELLQSLLEDVEIVSASLPAVPGHSPATAATLNVGTSPAADPARKKSVFVAMPFVEEFEDVYQFGIYATIRRCGYICEKVDEQMFSGSIVERIMDGIRNAEFVVADLSLEKPNVYLEVGFAWGMKKPVVLVAREGQRLHFDLSHHKCLFYKTIGRLAESLEKTVREMFLPGAPSE